MVTIVKIWYYILESSHETSWDILMKKKVIVWGDGGVN